MEDENKVLYYIKKAKIIIIIILILLIIIVGLFIYKNIMTNENTANFKSYLLENGYKDNKDGTYIKTVSENNKNIKYIFASDSSVISKEITENIDGGNINVLLNYEKNNQIDISLQFEGLNKNKIYGTLLQTGNYDAKKSSFDCKILMGNDFKSRCDDMKSEAKIFEKEVNELLNNSNTNAKYIS